MKLEPIELEVIGLSGIATYTEVIEQNPLIIQAIEKRLREAERNKVFRDTKERKRGTQKEMRAYAVVSAQILDELEDDPVMARKLVSKQKVWPEGIDPQREKKAGVESGAAFLKDKLYKLLAKQPYDSPDARRVYIGFIDALRAGLDLCKTIKDIDGLLRSFSSEALYKNFIGELTSEEISKISKTSVSFYWSERQKAAKKLEGVIGKSLYSYIFSRSNAVQEAFLQAELYNPISKEEQKAYVDKRLQYLRAEIESINQKQQTFAGWTNKQYMDRYVQSWTVSKADAAWQAKREGGMEMIISRVNGTYKLPGINENIKKLEAGLSIPDRYTARKESWAWTDKKTPEKKEDLVSDQPSLTINTKPKLSHIARSGGVAVPTIKGKDVATRYLNEVGIKAVQYGNSLPDDEREKHANFTFASLIDLEECIGVSVKDLNLISGLGIDFATRGTKGSAATYWSTYKVINLNRSGGDGSLAHEWAHYLDNALSKSTSTVMKINGKEGHFATLGGSPDTAVDTILKKWWKAATENDGTRTVNVIFRANTSYKLSSYLYKETLEETIKNLQTKRGFDTFEPRNMRVLAQTYGAIAAHYGLYAITVPLLSRYTEFYRNSQAMDADKAKAYWSSPVEMFARSFEEYLLEQMETKGISNNYLQSSNKWAKEYGVYPAGDEKTQINIVFDELFKYLAQKYPVGKHQFDTTMRTQEQVHELLSDNQSKPNETKPSNLLKMRLKAKAIKIKLLMQQEVGLSGYDIRPFKSISASQSKAVKDVLTLKRFKDINERTGGLIYKAFKEDINGEYETWSDYEIAFLEKAEYVLLDDIGTVKSYKYKKYVLTDSGKDFIQSVTGRLQSLRDVKSGSSLFPEDITGEPPTNPTQPSTSALKLKHRAKAIKIKLALQKAA